MPIDDTTMQRPTFDHRFTSAEQMEAFSRALHPVSADLIRVGPAGDGGYLVPDVLDGIVACFSPGVGDCSDFERACAERGMDVFLADATVDGPAVEHPNFHFVRRYIGGYTDDTTISLDDWVAASGVGDGDLLLQMDIEGAEYSSLLAASPELLRRFRVMAIEFHFLGQLGEDPFFGLAASMFGKLLESHVVVHAHPNNFSDVVEVAGVATPRVVEFTFVRRDHDLGIGYATRFPHPLDVENATDRPMTLPKAWYRADPADPADPADGADSPD
jgi:hypothetical protein